MKIMKRIITFLFIAIVSVATVSARIEHPSLLFTKQAVLAANNNPMNAGNKKIILDKADGFLKSNDLSKMDYLSLAYELTGDRKYADHIKDMLLNAVKAQTWSSSEMMLRNPAWHTELQVAHRSFACGLAYDAVYNTLTKDERTTIANGLQRLAVEPAMADWVNDETRIHSLNSMGHNWWSSCVCMGGFLALSLENEIPSNKRYVEKIIGILPEWFGFSGDILQNKMRSFDRDGGQYESVNYANFAIQEAALFLLACKNAAADIKVPDIPQLHKTLNYFAHASYPRNGELWSINFGDSHKSITAESCLEILYALGYCHNDNMLWYFSKVIDGQNRDGFFRSRPMGYVFMPSTKGAPEEPTLDKCALFNDFGIATLRDSWKNDATMLAVKSGHTWNHCHADANSLILFHKGVDLLKDAGNCNYGMSDYRNYFFQSQAHNVVLFNGQGQSTEQQYHGSYLDGNLSTMIDAGNIKYILADGTGPMSDKFSRNFRHYLWWDNIIYVIDDIKSHVDGKFEWLWHPGGDYRKNGGDIEISKDNAAIVLRQLYPQPLIPSGFLQDYPEHFTMEEVSAPSEDGKGEKYIALKLPAKTNQVKAVMAIILKDKPEQKELPVITRRQGENWIGLRIEYQDKVTDLYINQLADGRLMHSNSWIEADGWTTDAYMFGVSYRKDDDATKPDETFICYGSTLRRGKQLYYSSFTKHTLVKKGNKTYNPL
jgi:hypothetical protein